jgi:integrase
MARKAFTDRFIASLKPPKTGQVDWYDAKTSGLGIRVSHGGTRAFFIKYTHQGRQRRRSLGRYPELKLADARKLALAHKHELVVERRDPAEREKAERAALTFAELVDKYVEWAMANKRSWGEDARTLRKYFKPWEQRKATDIQREDLSTRANEIKDRHGPIMANRAFALIGRLYRWGYDSALIPPHNPQSMLRKPAKEKPRDRTYNEAELRVLWEAFGEMGVTGAAYKFALVTGVRINEAARMERNEIGNGPANFEGGVWTVPAGRSKNGNAHVVPLSDLALRILEDVPHTSDKYVFSISSPEKPIALGSRTRSRARKLSGVKDFRPHDMRRTVRTNVTPLGFPPHVGDRIMNHIQTGVRGIYDRHGYLAEKANFLNAWARYLEGITGEADTVVQLSRPA